MLLTAVDVASTVGSGSARIAVGKMSGRGRTEKCGVIARDSHAMSKIPWDTGKGGV